MLATAIDFSVVAIESFRSGYSFPVTSDAFFSPMNMLASLRFPPIFFVSLGQLPFGDHPHCESLLLSRGWSSEKRQDDCGIVVDSQQQLMEPSKEST